MMSNKRLVKSTESPFHALFALLRALNVLMSFINVIGAELVKNVLMLADDVILDDHDVTHYCLIQESLNSL